MFLKWNIFAGIGTNKIRIVKAYGTCLRSDTSAQNSAARILDERPWERYNARMWTHLLQFKALWEFKYLQRAYPFFDGFIRINT